MESFFFFKTPSKVVRSFSITHFPETPCTAGEIIYNDTITVCYFRFTREIIYYISPILYYGAKSYHSEMFFDLAGHGSYLSTIWIMIPIHPFSHGTDLPAPASCARVVHPHPCLTLHTARLLPRLALASCTLIRASCCTSPRAARSHPRLAPRAALLRSSRLLPRSQSICLLTVGDLKLHTGVELHVNEPPLEGSK